MGATWFRARADFKSRMRSTLALAVLLGLFGGAVLAAGAGARRTDSAYARFLRATRSNDLFVISGGPGFDVPPVDLHKVVRLPQVEIGVLGSLVYGLVTTKQGSVLTPDGGLSAIPDEAAMRENFRPKILAGRLPDLSRVDEIVVGYRSHPDPDVRVGAVVTVRVAKASSGVGLEGDPRKLPPDAFFPAFRARIVGIVLLQGEVQGSFDVFMTPAFYRAYADKAASLQVAIIALRHGLSDFPAFSRALDAITPQALVITTRDEAVYVHRATHLQAVALWLFAGLAALAGLVIFGQALARQLFLDSTDYATLRALGMTRGELTGLAMLRTVSIAVVGATVAVAVAVALSPLMPLGLARVVEPSPGVNVDPLVFGSGAAALTLLTLVLGAIPAWRASRARGTALSASERPGHLRPWAIGDRAARAGLPPTAVAGLRLALEPGRGRTAVPVWSTLLGVTLSVAAFVTAFSVGASFKHTLATPRLYGWGNIQLGTGNPYAEDMSDAVLPALRGNPAISAYGAGNLRHFVRVGPGGGIRVSVWAFDQIKGSVHLTIAEGGWPTSSHEIALGGKTLRALHAAVGDTVRVGTEAPAIAMRVVGRTVLPDLGFGPGLGEGAAMTLQALRQFVPDVKTNMFVMRVAAGTDPEAVARNLNPVVAPFNTDVEGPAAANTLTNLRRAEAVPITLAGILGLAAVGTLVHTLVTSIRRRRRDLAILKTLGFVKRQVSAAVAWQATTLVFMALLLGLPLGIAAGRWGWRLFADQLGVLPEPTIPLLTTVLAIPVAILVANLIALMPGRLAARTRPALVLRTE